MGKKYSKKETGRAREKKRKQMKLQKQLAKYFKGSSSSSSSSSSDSDPRQNSQIRRHLRRAAQRLHSASLPEEGTSSSSTDTWAAKAASIAAALGSVLVAQPPVPKPALPKAPVINQHMIAPPPLAAPIFPPVHPQLVPMGGIQSKAAPPMNLFQPMPAVAKAVPKTPPMGPVPKEPPAKASTPSAKALASLHDSWNLDLRQCQQCSQWTYYRNGICVNKSCPLNQ
jgi:hypothetical protein